MVSALLSTTEAARRLGISRATLYEWLARSNAGSFLIRGQSVTIAHYRSGAAGQGPIKFEAEEIERLKNLMRVTPRRPRPRRKPAKPVSFPGITVRLGVPDGRLGGNG